MVIEEANLIVEPIDPLRLDGISTMLATILAKFVEVGSRSPNRREILQNHVKELANRSFRADIDLPALTRSYPRTTKPYRNPNAGNLVDQVTAPFNGAPITVIQAHFSLNAGRVTLGAPNTDAAFAIPKTCKPAFVPFSD